MVVVYDDYAMTMAIILDNSQYLLALSSCKNANHNVFVSNATDPCDQDDWEHYSKLTNETGEKVQIVGDDLLVTNPKVELAFLWLRRLSNKNFQCHSSQGITGLIKLDLLLKALKLSKCPRKLDEVGETDYTFIADLSVGFATTITYLLLRIKEELGIDAVYARFDLRAPVEPY
ncbi:enolase-like [Durio zibethinus]|uniref:phosphopyruvate hydratase n=1 Tax=Durio zibethinus TaxID=66656 RepID=A0A6P6ALT6_DURZI|nr:enolase-like [Durio zibethinus]